ncbi:ATP synthase subunit I [Oceaniglobus ichthyenteri]|uniref:N-ATPase subunit AtpR n=1 Tax=Oceaniglobus ichthyenteri TaxID=2136177 RepID=UPI000D3D79E9|nr:ATP synthase subunit I [Oceaniglobus ichthyenteri]
MLASFDFPLFGFGLLAGALAAALFFAGLAWGMRLALRAPRPVAVLLPSAALRIALLLGAGWWVATWGVAAILGFALAFMVVRLILLTALQPKKEATPWK